jgi:restriction system protein
MLTSAPNPPGQAPWRQAALIGGIVLGLAIISPAIRGLLIFAAIGVGIWAYLRHKQRRDQALYALMAIQSAEIARYHAMGPREFEEAIAFLCQRDGCHNVQVVGGAGDLGADVIATAPDGRRLVIQCKRYGPTTKVGSPDLQRFGGTCWSVHGAQLAAVVTTSVFTRPATEYATAHGIHCYDETGLAGWASKTGPAPWMW